MGMNGMLLEYNIDKDSLLKLEEELTLLNRKAANLLNNIKENENFYGDYCLLDYFNKMLDKIVEIDDIKNV